MILRNILILALTRKLAIGQDRRIFRIDCVDANRLLFSSVATYVGRVGHVRRTELWLLMKGTTYSILALLVSAEGYFNFQASELTGHELNL